MVRSHPFARHSQEMYVAGAPRDIAAPRDHVSVDRREAPVVLRSELLRDPTLGGSSSLEYPWYGITTSESFAIPLSLVCTPKLRT